MWPVRKRLYQLPPGSWFLISGEKEPYFLDHIDGMYSVCYHKKQLMHIAAFQEVTETEKPEKPV
jgi:hypothetical protein